jgi:hypothetical protein
MSTTAAASMAGLIIPATELRREITAFMTDIEDDIVFDYSRREFLFGVLQGRRRALQPDLELLYAGAVHFTRRSSDDDCPDINPQHLLARVKCAPAEPI